MCAFHCLCFDCFILSRGEDNGRVGVRFPFYLVVLTRPRFADIKCPSEYIPEGPTGGQGMNRLSLSPCGALCLFTQEDGYVTGLDTETFSPAFEFKVDIEVYGAPAISQCKTRCYLPCSREGVHQVALPGGEVLRKVDSICGTTCAVTACGGVVVSHVLDGISVYDENLTLLRSFSHKGCRHMAVSDCGGWVITSSYKGMNARLWDVNTGEDVACVPAAGGYVALSRCDSVFAVVRNAVCSNKVQLYDWSGAALQNATISGDVCGLQFTQCGKYLVVHVYKPHLRQEELHQYDVATMCCVLVIPGVSGPSFAISPCSRVVVFVSAESTNVVTRHLYPHNE